MAPNDTAYKRLSCHGGGHELLCKLCRTFPPPAMAARFTVFWASRPYGPASWLALLLTKAGDVETIPSPTTSNTRVWICDICYKQIHVMKQISIRCNRIGTLGAPQMCRYPPSTIHRYLDLPSTHKIQTHNSHRYNTTPPLQTMGPSPLPTPHLHHPYHRNQIIDTRPTLPLFPHDW